MMTKRRLVGVFGGTFDPIHHGHLRMALEAKQALGLDELRLMPAASPPHRPCVLAAKQRLALLELAVASCSSLMVDARELEREGPSYTVDTLLSLRDELGAGTNLVLLMGADAFAGLTSWHRWQQIPTLAHVVVMQRPVGLPEPLAEPLREWLAKAYVLEDIQNQSAGCVMTISLSQLDISATSIRTQIQNGQSPQFLLPQPVLDLIVEKGWYQKEQN